MANSGGHASCMGTTIGGYEVLSHIGRGAMGVVYLARDTELNRRAALKVLLGSLARNPAAIKRFHLEAQAAAPLRHPNIVRIYAAGVDDGIPYIAMEYVEGEPLDRFLRRKGQIKWQNALYIAQQVAEALDCAHRSGVIHRDIKPANIMLDRQGRVRLTDFGIANVKQPNGALPEDTGTLATPQYMPPEQCRGQALYPTSDLFALGVTLYHMLTGEMPFVGESAPALIKSITNDEPPRVNRLVPDIPDDVARLVAHLLAKNPEERPESARAVCDRIDEIQSHKGGVSAMPAALTAFIKEQAQPRNVEHAATPKPKRRTTAVKAQASTSRSSREPMLRSAAFGGALLVALTALFVMLSYGFATRGAAGSAPAPRFDAIRFKRQFVPPVLTASINGDAFSCEDLAWIGAEPALLVRVVGRPGTLTQGHEALITVEPESLGASMLLGPPAGAGTAVVDSGYRAASFAVPITPQDSPLHNAVLMEYRQGANQVIAVAQRWNEAMPQPKVLCQMTTFGYTPTIEDLWRSASEIPAAVSPDGYTVCLAKHQEPEGGEYLVQRDVRLLPLNATGERLTSTGAPFVRQSIRYASDGRQIAYIREKAASERELWVVQASGGRADGVPLIVGALSDAAAFDPSGRRVAVSRYRAEGEPEVFLLKASANPAPVNIGQGLVCAESWAPSGEFLVVAARPEAAADGLAVDEPYQLFAIATEPPYARTRLTDVPGGIRPILAVSRDGAWAATVADTAAPATLIFVALDRMQPGANAGRS